MSRPDGAFAINPHIDGMAIDFEPTRAAALARLHHIEPYLGRDYAYGRNSDGGPDKKPSTTALSPYLRRRLLLEEEVVSAAIKRHGDYAATKFVSEVFWRTYFKGYLEAHPAIWTAYGVDLREQQDRLAGSSGLREAYAEAVEGRTGIDCFDDWARELVANGWLHNHTRMWFASIWMFTLRLPWTLGADFFLRHLLDGDPASNTLNWRWVGGLHTKGRVYAARAENIRRYTNGRYSPRGLNEDPAALEEAPRPHAVGLPSAHAIPQGEFALLLHLDDLHPESLLFPVGNVARIGGLVAHAPGATDRVRRFDAQAMTDALARAGDHFGCPIVPVEPGWADGMPMVTPWAPVGPSAEALPEGCLRIRRSWDETAWRNCRRGYFAAKSAMPKILRELQIG